jgi:DNA-directed RNA polymerase specialized sigma subunit
MSDRKFTSSELARWAPLPIDPALHDRLELLAEAMKQLRYRDQIVLERAFGDEKARSEREIAEEFGYGSVSTFNYNKRQALRRLQAIVRRLIAQRKIH